MQRLGHVGPPVIDHDPHGERRRFAPQPVVVVDLLDVPRDVFVGQDDVDEPRPGERQFLYDPGRLDRIDHVLRDPARVGPVLPGRRERPVALELAQVRPVGNPHFAKASIIAGRFEGVRDNDREFVCQRSHGSPFRLDCRRW